MWASNELHVVKISPYHVFSHYTACLTEGFGPYKFPYQTFCKLSSTFNWTCMMECFLFRTVDGVLWRFLNLFRKRLWAVVDVPVNVWSKYSTAYARGICRSVWSTAKNRLLFSRTITSLEAPTTPLAAEIALDDFAIAETCSVMHYISSRV